MTGRHGGNKKETKFSSLHLVDWIDPLFLRSNFADMITGKVLNVVRISGFGKRSTE